MRHLVHALEGPSSFYGIEAESVNSLIVSYLQPFFEVEDEKDEMKGKVEEAEEGEIENEEVEEVEKEIENVDFEEEDHSVLDAFKLSNFLTYPSAHEDDAKVANIIELLQHSLKSPKCVFQKQKVKKKFVGLCIQQVSGTSNMFMYTITLHVLLPLQVSKKEIFSDAQAIVHQMKAFKEARILSFISSFQLSDLKVLVVSAVKEIFVSHTTSYDGVNLKVQVVVHILQQWLTRVVCKTILHLLTPEALVYHRMKIPSSYVTQYLLLQHHFSLKDAISQQLELLQEDSR